MCTAATYKTKDFYFGRTLDYEFSYGDQIVITPRNYAFNFRHVGDMKNHYAIIGMAHVAEDYPLYYDAMNEKGVAMAGLNFVGNAVYAAIKPDVENIAQFEFIPWILSQCSSVTEVREKLDYINEVHIDYDKKEITIIGEKKLTEEQVNEVIHYILENDTFIFVSIA